MRPSCLKGVYRESIPPKCHEAGTNTKLKPNEIFNDFAISQDPIDKIDPNFFHFKDMN